MIIYVKRSDKHYLVRLLLDQEKKEVSEKDAAIQDLRTQVKNIEVSSAQGMP